MFVLWVTFIQAFVKNLFLAQLAIKYISVHGFAKVRQNIPDHKHLKQIVPNVDLKNKSWQQNKNILLDIRRLANKLMRH